jgi:hypothetical protein
MEAILKRRSQIEIRNILSGTEVNMIIVRK